MKRVMAGLLVTTGLLSAAGSASAYSAYPLGTVNIRSGPGTEFAIIAQLADNQRAAILSHDGSWLKVKTNQGTVGYMADWVTREVFDEATEVTVTTDILNVRTGPGLDYSVLAQVTQGQRFRVLEGLGGWYKIQVGSLGAGWVSATYTTKASAAPPAPTPAPTPAPSPEPTPTPEPQLEPLPQPEPPAPAPAEPIQTPSLTASPATAPEQTLVKEVVVRTATSIYVGRATDYEWVQDVGVGERMTFLETTEGWVKVQTAKGNRGWIDGRYVTLRDKGVDFWHQPSYGMVEGEWNLGYPKIREVVSGTGLHFRSGPSATAPIRWTLRPGERMVLIQVPNQEYVQVMLGDGSVGWVSRNSLKPVAGLAQESARLTTAGVGILRLEVTGQTGMAAIRTEGTLLHVGLGANTNRFATIPVGDLGVHAMSMDQNGLTLRFQTPVSYTVVSQTASTTVLEIRPVLQAVSVIQGTDRTVYRFRLDGTTVPEGWLEPGGVALHLRGVKLGTGAIVPAEIKTETLGKNLLMHVPWNGAYTIKRSPGYVDLVLFRPGLAGKTIVIDPGHGGVETGAVGPSGLREKEVNLAISLKLRDRLTAAGATVIMTRSTDVRCVSPDALTGLPWSEHLRLDLSCRSTTANTNFADVFVSVHSNANPSSSVRGTETYWSPESLNYTQSSVLASLIQQEMLGALGLTNLGVKKADFAVIKFTDAPAALAEVAFLSNWNEEALLSQDSVRTKAANAIYSALDRFFE